ncbi:MAG: NAD(P)/FAD-dependent oxidoreductase [Clostridia bacterium]|nr:NAD(P)/FAD-dependent oxidoreductase [Clostridia bacterium]
MKKIIIVGGGAAGMMAAIFAARQGVKVTVFEKNQKLGRKLLITGKGRCNITNNCDRETLISNVPQNPRFLYGAFSRFSPQDVMDFFEDLGVKLKTERGARVFPVSDQAQEVVFALCDEMKRLGVVIQNSSVDEICCKDGRVCGVISKGVEYSADAVLLATGGLSYPGTGSTGDGYKMAAQLGHTIVPPRASLVPITAESKLCSSMQGLSLKNVVLSVYNRKQKCVFEEMGEMLFTHFGVSGPLVLSASAHMRDIENDKYILKIDLKPALDREKLNARVLRDFDERKNQDISNALRGLLPAKLVLPVLLKAGISADVKVHSIDKTSRARLIDVLKGFEICVDSFRPISEAIITSGGIKVSEIDPKTMMSRLINSLYFAGEIIDTDAYTGGFNLQIAWSTAYVAACEMSKED